MSAYRLPSVTPFTNSCSAPDHPSCWMVSSTFRRGGCTDAKGCQNDVRPINWMGRTCTSLSWLGLADLDVLPGAVDPVEDVLRRRVHVAGTKGPLDRLHVLDPEPEQGL